MIQFVRHLNKPYRRIDFVIGGFLKIIDGIVDIFSFGYIRTSFHIWLVNKNIHEMLSYLENKTKNKGE